MKLAILHHHLNPGGVTRVIANHLLALDAVLPPEDGPLEVLILSDGQTSGWPRDLVGRLSRLAVKLVAVPNLAYDSRPIAEPQVLADQLRDVLTQHDFGPQCTLLHVHNHSLGKNASLPGALRQLASEGYPLLLQVHDFAEDFRAENYRHLTTALKSDDGISQVYFHGPHVHLAMLNGRDVEVMRRAGVPEEQLHYLPNPVLESDGLPTRAEARAALSTRLGIPHDEAYVLYPVRGIRRKNIGEMLLLSLLMNAAECRSITLALTLAPLNPAAVPYYNRWKSLAAELELNCRFDTGGAGGLSFAQNTAAADCVLTTSIAEGFGMAFLESWLAGRALIGRNLPEITADFADAGLRLDTLYDRLAVPLDWVGRGAVIDAMSAACRRVYTDYGLAPPEDDIIEAAVDRMTAEGTIDFGRLNEPLQEIVIRLTHRSADARAELRRLNPVFDRWDELDQNAIEANRGVVREAYSLHSGGERLLAIYRDLIDSPRTSLDAAAAAPSILSAFLDLDRFHLIRT